MKKLLLLGLSILLFSGVAMGQRNEIGGKNPISVNKLYWPAENDYVPTIITTANEVGVANVMPDHDEMWTICKPSGIAKDSFDAYIIVDVKTNLLLSQADNQGIGFISIDSIKVITKDTLGGIYYLNTKVPPFASHYQVTVDGVTGNAPSPGVQYETWVIFKNNEVGNIYKTEKMFFPTEGDMIPSIAGTADDTSKSYQLPNKNFSEMWIVCKPSGFAVDSIKAYVVLQVRSQEIISEAGNNGVGWVRVDSVIIDTPDTLAGKYYEVAGLPPATEYRVVINGITDNHPTNSEYETWVIIKE